MNADGIKIIVELGAAEIGHILCTIGIISLLITFAYLEVISWLESKINDEHVQDVIKKKYKKSRRT